MEKKKYYAVVKGRTPGIYFTWDDCKAQIEHFPGAIYKGFETIMDAGTFVESNKDDVVKADKQKQPVSDETCLVAYVDGSYDDSKKRYAYGCVMVFEGQVITLNGSASEEENISMRNVAGEILGSQKAIEWAIEHGYKKITIVYD